MLLRLWTLLRPDEELAQRRSRQWTHIGFQGDNPATDFRGMVWTFYLSIDMLLDLQGLLGLENLLFYAEHDSNCQRVLKLSQHGGYG